LYYFSILSIHSPVCRSTFRGWFRLSWQRPIKRKVFPPCFLNRRTKCSLCIICPTSFDPPDQFYWTVVIKKGCHLLSGDNCFEQDFICPWFSVRGVVVWRGPKLNKKLPPFTVEYVNFILGLVMSFADYVLARARARLCNFPCSLPTLLYFNRSCFRQHMFEGREEDS
jgi:hypothetical protein